jgi:hypothetical protein
MAVRILRVVREIEEGDQAMTTYELLERIRELVGFSGSMSSFKIVERIEEALNEYDKEVARHERERQMAGA